MPAGNIPERTAEVLGRDLNATHTLVGEAGGLSAVYESEPSSAMPGLAQVTTEHGPLYLDPDHEYTVLGSTNSSNPAVCPSSGTRIHAFDATGERCEFCGKHLAIVAID